MHGPVNVKLRILVGLPAPQICHSESQKPPTQ